MWSEKKYVDITINVLLFLIGINFLHLGQLILPIICFIQFVDNKFRFHVADIKTFVILCLFAISFCYFSYDLGFYCVMGFCLPMAYYIGSNLKVVNEENIKKIIYIIAFGMASHLILNFGYDCYVRGYIPWGKQTHYDIWLQDVVMANGTAMNYVLVIGSAYYLFFFEKNMKIKYLGGLLYMVSFIYNFSLGRRMPVLLFVIAFVGSFLLECIYRKNSKLNKTPFYIFLACIILVIILVIFYKTDFLGFRKILKSFRIVNKFLTDGFSSSGRIEILLDFIKLMPYYLWGNQQISSIVGIQAHDLWTDVYDYAGVITFVLLLLYTFILVRNKISFVKKENVTNEFKILVISLSMCILIQLMLEPVMTGASLILICTVMIEALFEKII